MVKGEFIGRETSHRLHDLTPWQGPWGVRLISSSNALRSLDWTVAHKDPMTMGFSRQEYWSGLVCPPPWDLSDPGITPASPAVPVLQADSLPLSHWGSCEKGTEIIINGKIKMAVRELWR